MRRSFALKVAGLIIIFVGFALLPLSSSLGPVARLAAASLGLLVFIKVAALLWQLSDGLKIGSKLGLAAFLLTWPGTQYDGFEKRAAQPPRHTGRLFLESWLQMLAGVAGLSLAAYFGRGESTVWNYVALVSILFIIHMGLIEVMADGLRLVGFNPKSLFDRPVLANSLRDFWSERWNRAFVDMNKIFLLEPLRGRVPGVALLLGIFLVSGVLHEVAISFPAGGPWGWPLLYFAFQGIGVVSERFIKWPRPLVIAWILMPLPILFPPQFVDLFLGSLTEWIYQNLLTRSLADYLYYGFLLGAAFHALVLCASVQVPGKLGWREEFKKLRSLNRKAFWTYGAYILTIIIFMGGVSLYLAHVPNHGWTEWIWILFIALFWWARVGIDFLYMKHEDWPQGPLFTVGHICLTTLFITMTALYTGLGIAIGMRL